MLIRAVCFSLIFSGGVLLSVSALRYMRLSRKFAVPDTSFSMRFVGWASRVLICFFVIGYAVGAVDMVLNDDIQPIYYFVSIVFFFGAVFVFLMVLLQLKTSAALQRKDAERQQALDESEENNALLRAKVEEQLREVTHQGRLLRAVNEVAHVLLTSEVEEFGDALYKSMELLAAGVNVNRVGVWENSEKDGRLYCTLVQEWVDGVAPQKDTPFTAQQHYDEVIPGWRQTFAAGRSINAIVRSLSESEQAQLIPQGVVSLLAMPVFLRDRLWGFVSFDDCHNERTFTDSEEGILRSGSLLLANAIMRNEMTGNLMQAREEALSSTKAKSSFLANMSHEIRTPINAITGMATIARGTDDIEKIHDCLDKVDAASRQLLGVINDILDMSKIEADKMELASEPFELRTAFNNIKSIIGVRAAEKNQTLTLDIAPDVPRVAVGDDMRLSQILLNLLSNAVKFTPEGGDIAFSLRLLHTKDGTHTLESRVCDNGIGITKEQHGRLFRSFEQADKHTSKLYGGSGLGLAISRSIARLMSGDITVESEPDKGSCFTVRFCLRAGSADMLAQAGEKQSYDFGGRTALLVEDIAINREIVMELLGEYAMSVDCAENGEEAVRLFLADPLRYDIIFMDLHMPVMDGYAATEAIRSSRAPRASEVPILAMTANAFSEDVARCRAAGMDDHIAKPVDVELLLQKVECLTNR